MNHDEKMIEIKPEDHPDIAGGWVWTNLELRWINKRIAEAVVAEREACAKLCDAADKSTHPADLADAIRAREQA